MADQVGHVAGPDPVSIHDDGTLLGLSEYFCQFEGGDGFGADQIREHIAGPHRRQLDAAPVQLLPRMTRTPRPGTTGGGVTSDGRIRFVSNNGTANAVEIGGSARMLLATTSGTVRKNGQEFGNVDIVFSHIDRNLSGLKFPEHNFVFTPQFKSLLSTFQADLAPTPEPDA